MVILGIFFNSHESKMNSGCHFVKFTFDLLLVHVRLSCRRSAVRFPDQAHGIIQSCQVEHVKSLNVMNQGGYPHHHMVAPLNGANSASGAIFRTIKYTVYANVISVLPRPFLQGAAPCPFLVTSCPFSKGEMTPCPFD